MDNGNAAENPIKDPKVITYKTLITHVCLFEKILYWRSKLVRMAPGKSFNRNTVLNSTPTSTNSFGTPKPEPFTAAGSISHKPAIAVAKPISNITKIIPNETNAAGCFGVTSSVLILFMPNQVANANGINNNNQTKPPFWTQVSLPAGILPIKVPLAFCRIIASPPPAKVKAPNVINNGTKICMVVTPKLPNPALRPSAKPCCFLGKKKLMLDMEAAKLPPPIPDNRAINWNTQNGVVLSCNARPVPIAGSINKDV